MQRLFKGIVAVFMALATTSCETDTVYSQYTHAAIVGWEKNEPLTFVVDSITDTGTYSMFLGMRISDAYPFRNLHMVVEQTVYPSKHVITDTVTCNVVDKRGTMLGYGVSLYQYDLPIMKRNYQKGDSLSIKVRHNMKREILPGIADVGITIKKN